MPTIMLRGLPPALVDAIMAHGEALGAHGREGCVRALIDYAIDQRTKRAAGGLARAQRMTAEERSAGAKVAVDAREARREPKE